MADASDRGDASGGGSGAGGGGAGGDGGDGRPPADRDRGIYELGASDYYDLLGVDPDADRDTIKRRATRAIKEAHPDQGAGGAPDAERRLKYLTEAREVLLDEDSRRRYDAVGHITFVEEEFDRTLGGGGAGGDPVGDGDTPRTGGEGTGRVPASAGEGEGAGRLSGPSAVYDWGDDRPASPAFVGRRLRRTWLSRAGWGVLVAAAVGGAALAVPSLLAGVPGWGPPLAAAGAAGAVVGTTAYGAARRLAVGTADGDAPAPPRGDVLAALAAVVAALGATAATPGPAVWVAAGDLLAGRPAAATALLPPGTAPPVGSRAAAGVGVAAGFAALVLGAAVAALRGIGRVVWTDRYLRGRFLRPHVWEGATAVLATLAVAGVARPRTPVPAALARPAAPVVGGEATLAAVGVVALAALPLVAGAYAVAAMFCRRRLPRDERGGGAGGR